jgi:uncharacterized protein YjeT (DUF2065 family)
VDLAPLLLAALGCALILEGLPYSVAPGPTRRAMRLLAEEEDDRLRVLGIALLLAGLTLVWCGVRMSR